MIETFEIAVKGGIIFFERDFAVLGTNSMSHEGNLKALGLLQIFFKYIARICHLSCGSLFTHTYLNVDPYYDYSIRCQAFKHTASL